MEKRGSAPHAGQRAGAPTVLAVPEKLRQSHYDRAILLQRMRSAKTVPPAASTASALAIDPRSTSGAGATTCAIAFPVWVKRTSSAPAAMAKKVVHGCRSIADRENHRTGQMSHRPSRFGLHRLVGCKNEDMYVNRLGFNRFLGTPFNHPIAIGEEEHGIARTSSEKLSQEN